MEKVFPQVTENMLIYGLQPANGHTQKIIEYDGDRAAHYQIVGFDTETVRDAYLRHQLTSTQLTYLDGKQLKNFINFDVKRGISRFYDFPKKAFVFAHNLSFDLRSILGDDLLELFLNLGRKETIQGWRGYMRSGQMCLAEFYNTSEKRRLVFTDTMNYFRGSLENVAKRYLPANLQKLDKPDYLGEREPTKAELNYFVQYAVRDAEICYNLGLKIYDRSRKHDVRFSQTPAGRGGRIFRKRFLDKPWHLPTAQYSAFIWNCYAGARFESYGRGLFKGNVKVYDINSLYPYAATFPLPYDSVKKIRSFTVEEWEKDRDNIVGWYHAKGAYLKPEMYPQLPYRVKRTGQNNAKLYYPLSFDSYGTMYELNQAYDSLALKEIHLCGFYPTKGDIENPFKKYVDHFYDRKADLDKIKETVGLTDVQREERDDIKLSLNSLYGKTAERHRNETTGIWKAGRLFNPAICSLITGKARAEISKHVKNYNGLYIDTDSCFTYQHVPTSNALGGFKKEAEGRAWLIRPKLYFITKKDGTILKCARHSFRIQGRKVYQMLNDNLHKNRTTIKYDVKRLAKFRESVKRRLGTLKELTQQFTVAMAADDKRVYDDNLATIDDLKYNKTLSTPVEVVD